MSSPHDIPVSLPVGFLSMLFGMNERPGHRTQRDRTLHWFGADYDGIHCVRGRALTDEETTAWGVLCKALDTYAQALANE